MKNQYKLQDAFFFILLLALSIAFFKVIAPFFLIIFFAFLMTLIFTPLFTYLQTRFSIDKKFAAMITIVTVILVVAIPAFLLGLQLYKEISEAVKSFPARWPQLLATAKSSPLVSGVRETSFVKSILELPAVASFNSDINNMEIGQRFAELFAMISDELMDFLAKAVLNVSSFLFQMIILLYMLYFILIDGSRFKDMIFKISPLSYKDEDRLLREVTKTINATLLGTMFIALIEAIVGSIMLAIAGVPSVVLWGVCIFIFSMIPLIGASLVFVPGALYVILTGHIFGGIFMLIFSLLFLGLTQNIVKPKLVGDQSGLHPVMIVLSSLGAIVWMGPVGFLVGPIFASLFIAVWKQFALRFRRYISVWPL